eukprot:jgi/Psemu1/6178/gm1.6178_g
MPVPIVKWYHEIITVHSTGMDRLEALLCRHFHHPEFQLSKNKGHTLVGGANLGIGDDAYEDEDEEAEKAREGKAREGKAKKAAFRQSRETK